MEDSALHDPDPQPAPCSRENWHGDTLSLEYAGITGWHEHAVGALQISFHPP